MLGLEKVSESLMSDKIVGEFAIALLTICSNSRSGFTVITSSKVRADLENKNQRRLISFRCLYLGSGYRNTFCLLG